MRRAAPAARSSSSCGVARPRAGTGSTRPEVWHHYGGAPLELAISTDGRGVVRHRLGDDVLAGDRPQIVVPAGAWQSARSLGAWTLVGCTVSPAFSFDGFELAPDGWEPGGS